MREQNIERMAFTDISITKKRVTNSLSMSQGDPLGPGEGAMTKKCGWCRDPKSGGFGEKEGRV